MIYIDVDTAVEVPVNACPLIDDTDFKSRETAVAYNAAGMDLVWNFITPNGTITQTAVTPTTAGDYDWSHIGDGMYKIEIPASGGASINNDTEGVGYFSGVCTGVLPWRGPDICFRASGLNDALIESAYSATRGLAGTALPAAAADAAGGLVISDAGGLDIDAKLSTATSALATAASLATAQADLDTLTGTDGVTLATSQPNYAPSTHAALDVWHVAASSVITASTIGLQLKTNVDAVLSNIEADTQDLQTQIGSAGAGLSAVPWNASWDAEVQSECTDALNAYDPPTKAELDSGLAALNDPTAAAIADAVWTEAIADHSGTAGSTAESLNAAGGSGDPWTTTLPGSYTGTQAGKILSDILVDTGTTIPGTITTMQGNVTDILADTNELQTDWANGGRLDLILDTASSAGDPWSTALPGAYGAGTAGYIVGTYLDAPISTVDTVVDGIATTATNIEADTQDLQTQIGTAGAGLTDLGGMSTTMKAQVESEANDALVAIHLDHLLAVDYDPASKPGVSTALLNEMIASDAGVSQWSTNALENAPGGASSATLAKQNEILAVVQGLSSFSNYSSTTVDLQYIVRGDSYDGTANAKLSWTSTKDYQSGWTGTFTVRHRVTDASLLSASITVVDATTIEVSLSTTDTAFTALTADDEFGPHPYDIQMVSGSSEITERTGIVVVRKDRTTA